MQNFTSSIRCLLALLLPLVLLSGTAFGQYGKLRGKITEEDEPLPFTIVYLLEAGTIKNGTQTDELGEYSIPRIKPGTYTVVARNYTNEEKQFEGVVISPGSVTKLDFQFDFYHDPFPCPCQPEPRGFEDFDHLMSSGFNFSRSYIRQIQR